MGLGSQITRRSFLGRLGGSAASAAHAAAAASGGKSDTGFHARPTSCWSWPMTREWAISPFTTARREKITGSHGKAQYALPDGITVNRELGDLT